ncbi:MAG: hypothetical protein IPF66_02655 [Holophagales bacterium]|nr:hypothetical protein [Holophagales bacterium]
MALRLLVVVAAAAFASHEVITPQMMALRDRLPTLVELLPGADPARKEWGRLHAFSAAVLLVRLLASTALFVLLSRKARRTIAVTANAAAEGPTAA